MVFLSPILVCGNLAESIMSNKLSVVVITFNEERNIERCLKSVQNIADEIIVVDSFSTDNTGEICKKYNVKLHQEKWLGYSEQKNLANSLTENKLIFSIDADEVVSPELEKSILEIKETAEKSNSYSVKRLTNYCGKWIHHCGWYPDSKIRLWFKDEAKWTGELHESLIFNHNNKVNHIKGDLFHYSYHSVHQHLAQINAFTEIGAKEDFNKGKKSNIIIIIVKGGWKFIRDYFFKLGILDGYYGFVICSLSSHATFVKYIKLRELNKNNK